MRIYWPCILLLSLFVSCKDNRSEPEVTAVAAQPLFADYQLWAEEGRPEATLMAQFREGEEGDALLLPEGSELVLDAEALVVDSARQTGTFYEVAKPLDAFVGEHRLAFTDATGKEYAERFRFSPFRLTTEFPEAIRKRPFAIGLSNVQDTTALVRLVITDTAFATSDVNEELRLRRGAIPVTASMLSRLAPGPISIEIFLEETLPLQQPPKGGGRLLITYGLRREVQLVD